MVVECVGLARVLEYCKVSVPEPVNGVEEVSDKLIVCTWNPTVVDWSKNVSIPVSMSLFVVVLVMVVAVNPSLSVEAVVISTVSFCWVVVGDGKISSVLTSKVSPRVDVSAKSIEITLKVVVETASLVVTALVFV
jgi:hypothetical protein